MSIIIRKNHPASLTDKIALAEADKLSAATSTRPSTKVDPAIISLVRSLARAAAREDHGRTAAALKE